MKYTAKPVEVDAFEIVNITKHSRYTSCLVLHLDDVSAATSVIATPEMLARIKPKIGDYYVMQSDGYAYLNPKEVFERKYRPTIKAAPLDAVQSKN